MLNRPGLSKRTEIILKIFLALAGPLLLLILLEGGAFLWESYQASGLYAWELVASRRIELIADLERTPGYTLMQPGATYEWKDVPVVINSHGFRTSEFSQEKPANTYRIVNVGDSIAMGWGVAEEATYGRQLETMLNQRAGGDLRYEVINAGVPGWNPENELAFLQKQGIHLSPDLILLEVTIVNDIYGENALERNSGSPTVIEWLRSNTYFWPFLSVQFQWMQARAQGKDRIDVIDPPTKPESYFPLDPNAPKWLEVWSWIAQMALLAEAEGVPFVVMLFPLEHQVLDEAFPTTPQDVLTAKAKEAGIPVIDLLPAFQRACETKPGGRCELEDYYLFADVWMHPSELGHQIAAEEILDLLAGANTN